MALFIVFEWGIIFESAVGKWEVKCNVKFRPNYFSVNVSILAVVISRQMSKKRQFCGVFSKKTCTLMTLSGQPGLGIQSC